jgi:hypothetical protein
MATYIVKAGGGGDYTTIAAGLGAASHDDTVEIQDSSTYVEGNITISANNIRLIATGSNTPIWNGGGNNVGLYMYGSGTFFRGIEFKNFNQYALQDGDADGRSIAVSGCYFHGIGIRPIRRVAGKGGDEVGTFSGSSEYALIDQCKFIHSGSSQTFLIYGSYVKLRNSLFTGDTDQVLFSDDSYTNTTASFCTVISNGTGGSPYWIVNEFAKVINCVVSSSIEQSKGISAANHTYNVVNIPGNDAPSGYHPWGDYDGSNGSAGTGDTTGLVYFADPSSDDFTLAQTSSTAAAVASLVAYYPMITGSGPPTEETLYDYSDADNEHDGTMQSGVEWESSSFGPNAQYGLKFDGASANSRVDLPSGMVDDYPISVSYWFKTADVERVGIHFYIHIASGKWCVGGLWSDGVYYVGARYRAVQPQWFTDDEWTHIVVTQTSTSAILIYVNGVDRTDNGINDLWLQVGTVSQLGTRNSVHAGAQVAYSGSMEDVSIWDIELSAPQVAALYNRGLPNRDVAGGLPVVTLCNCAIDTGIAYEGLGEDGLINQRPDDIYGLDGNEKPLFSGYDRGCYNSSYLNKVYSYALTSSGGCGTKKVMGIVDGSVASERNTACPKIGKVMGMVKKCVIE